MGRSVPTWRDRIERQLEELAAYQRGLRSDERKAFEMMTKAVRERRAAGGMLPGEDVWNIMLMSMILGAWLKIEVLEKEIKDAKGVVDSG